MSQKKKIRDQNRRIVTSGTSEKKQADRIFRIQTWQSLTAMKQSKYANYK